MFLERGGGGGVGGFRLSLIGSGETVGNQRRSDQMFLSTCMSCMFAHT